jgi:CheY-like chemotaxis protein
MKPFFKAIILVDDDPTTNHYHQIVLREWGVAEAIHVTTNGLEALTFLKSYPQDKPSLIMLDINMPVMNGFEFLEEYQKLDELYKASFVVFMLTSSLHPRDVERAEKFKDLNGYCEKPMTEEMIHNIITQIMESMTAYAE